jgi:drug/metabolite transporter (DMT)-like permease
MTKTSDTPPVGAPRLDMLGYGLAISGAALFSTKGIFIKLAYGTGIGPETVLALRMIVAVPVYLVIAVLLLMREPELRRAMSGRAVIGSALVGILGYYVASYLDFSGLQFISVQYERLVLFTYPFFSVVLGAMFFKDRFTWAILPGLAVSYLGLGIIFGWNLAVSPDGLVAGTALVIASAITFALYQHLAKREMAAVGSRLFTCIAMIAAGLVGIAHNTLQHGVEAYFTFTPAVWGYGLALGIVGTVLPSFLMNGAIGRIGARATSSTGAWGPVMTIALAVFVLGEAFTIWHALGTALVIGGSVWFARSEQRAKKAG